ncbi:hypothetical protein [Microbacterium sediminis]|uniref:Uncharacterized protein n=1 Tax=Microbacterium sediminis TaxID=904291 RepID=A0A1B9NDH0_9MICO|nr:hypothetical protein [Microbacterium sediminis]OCG74604.1 hypothetical protein A7J15_03440 [Microbacterium sediminis]QBR74897.1 hypothetical protein E3O41_11160 [Microbacterium sediminis]
MTFAPDTVDPDVPQPPRRDGELFRYVTQPAAQRRVMRKSLLTLLFTAALTIAAIVLMVLIPDAWWLFLIFAVLGLIGSLIWGAMFFGARAASRATGDDLIDLIVLPGGFLTQGGLFTPWQEVSKIEVVRTTGAPDPAERRSIGEAAGQQIAQGLTHLGGANITVNIHVHDAKAVAARAATPSQKLAVFDSAGYLHTGLGLRQATVLQPLIVHLQQECARRGTPFELAV